jgi:methyl-accepting chemotaxis protein
MKRWAGLLLSIVFLSAALAVARYVSSDWAVYAAIGLGVLAGLGFDRLARIHAGDEDTLARMGAFGLSASARDYLSLRRMAQRLVRRGGHTAIASAEVSQHADKLSARLTEQDTIVREAVSSMGAITTAIEQVSASASQVSELASRSRNASQHSRDALEHVITEMSALAERSEEALEMLETLSKKTDSVRNVTSLIEEIAEQTNLLSLNASIEAARAGEHGRGFAVVAGEVRGLARRTADATKQVESLVEEIGTSSQKVVDNIGHLMRRVGERAQEVEKVGAELTTMTQDFDTVDTEIAGIAEATSDTRTHSRQVAATLGTLQGQVVDGNRDMHSLAEQAQALMSAAEGVVGELAQQRLDSRHQTVYLQARSAADQIGKLLTRALKDGELTESALFDLRYEPIEGTDPPKYHTAYDRFTDRHLPAIQEPILETLGAAYVMACDRRGYVPTHNRRCSHELTGDYQTDLKHSRHKRIFDDATGSRCGDHTDPLLVQTYKRDTGEVMHDLSVPIFVAGRHWGGVRIGYQPVEAPQPAASQSAPAAAAPAASTPAAAFGSPAGEGLNYAVK